jgi:hypothetical protein
LSNYHDLNKFSNTISLLNITQRETYVMSGVYLALLNKAKDFLEIAVIPSHALKASKRLSIRGIFYRIL